MFLQRVAPASTVRPRSEIPFVEGESFPSPPPGDCWPDQVTTLLGGLAVRSVVPSGRYMSFLPGLKPTCSTCFFLYMVEVARTYLGQCKPRPMIRVTLLSRTFTSDPVLNALAGSPLIGIIRALTSFGPPFSRHRVRWRLPLLRT